MFVLLITNNDGGFPATLHATLDDARRAALHSLTTLEDGPPLTDYEKMRIATDLAAVDGTDVQGVQGSSAWKEWAYIAPVADGS